MIRIIPDHVLKRIECVRLSGLRGLLNRMLGGKTIISSNVDHEWEAIIYTKTRIGVGCPYCSNKKTNKENCLANTSPDVAIQWHPTKNGKLTSNDVFSGSTHKVWWMCEKGHEWEAKIRDRTKPNGTGCPYCANQKVCDDNSLTTLFPNVAEQWHPTKNGKVTPNDLFASSTKRVWWFCETCNHEWEKEVLYRTRLPDPRCPNCISLGYLKTELSLEWHPTKNGALTPFDVTLGSNTPVWWSCKRGHEWRTSVNARAGQGTGCPHCSSQTSFPEQALYFYMKQIFSDCENKKMFPEIRRKFEADLYIPSLRLAVEYDGYYFHKDKAENDSEKMRVFNENGIQTLRIREEGLPLLESFEDFCFECDGDDLQNLESCALEILDYIQTNYDLEQDIKAGIESIDMNLERDRLTVYESYLMSEKKKNLTTLYPKLREEWHPTKNGKLIPEYFTKGSNEKVWWLCENGHDFESVIAARTKGVGCPYCVRKRVSSDNNLSVTHPDLIKEWNFAKNDGRSPEDVLAGTHEEIWWICRKGHEWKAPVKRRTTNEGGCPYCSGHKVHEGNCLATLFPAAAKEWHPMKNGTLTPFKVHAFSRQTAWYVCSNGHEIFCKVKERTKWKDCPYCSGQRMSEEYCLASSNPELANQWHPSKNGKLTPNDVFPRSDKKAWWICEKGHEWEAQILSRNSSNGGSKCPYCSNQKVGADNSLATTRPDIAKQWHPTKNDKLTPHDVVAGSNKKAWWICEKRHEWSVGILNRANGSECPYCLGRIPTLETCLQTLYTDIAKQWHPTKNGSLTPFDVTVGSSKKVWWICGKGHEWKTSINHRTLNGTNCPYCTNQRASEENCLQTLHPDIAKQWHPANNGELTPNNVVVGSTKKVWWVCDKGHEWEAMIRNRTKPNGTGCPYCANKKVSTDNYLATIYPNIASNST